MAKNLLFKEINFPITFSYYIVDISIGIVDLLQELTDIDTLNESEDAANLLVDALVRIDFT